MTLAPGAGQKSPLSLVLRGRREELPAKLSRGGSQENSEHVQNVGCARPGL